MTRRENTLAALRRENPEDVPCVADDLATDPEIRAEWSHRTGNGKKSFENHRVWFYGLKRNTTHLVVVNYVRAVAMLINFETNHEPEKTQQLLDAWQ